MVAIYASSLLIMRHLASRQARHWQLVSLLLPQGVVALKVLLKRGGNGISVDCDDHAAMAEAMQYILENTERFERQQIVRDAKEMFSVRALSDILKNTYESFGWQMKTSILSRNDKNLG